jgi:ABC-type transport system involved in multi-copper enzyme maturation permease subunit
MLLLLAALMPFFAGMAGFNQTAGEIGSRGLRFLLLRTDRRSLFFGRFLAALVFATVGLVLLVTAVVAYMALKLDLYSGSALVSWGAQGLVALFFVLLPHLAMMALVSAMLDSALTAFSVGTAAVGLPVLLLKGLAKAVESLQGGSVDWLDRLQPWGWKYDLLSPSLGVRGLALAVMLAFTAAFLFVGLRTFERRDV